LSKEIRKYLRCEWLEFLLVFQEFKFIIKENKGDMEKTKDFCKINELNFDSIVNFIEFRYDLIMDIHAISGIRFSTSFESTIENLFSLSVKIVEGREKDIKVDYLIEEFKEMISCFKQIFYSSYKLNIAVCTRPHTFRCLYTNMIVKHYNHVADPGSIILYDSIIIRKNTKGYYEPSFINGITNISNSEVPIEPMVQLSLF
jgi:hypothetical protein